jgi:hypothetical protein
MSVLPVLEVVLGLSFVYLLLALITTTLTEWVSRTRNGRGRMLKTGMLQLLGEDRDPDSGITREVLEHSLIRSMTQKGKLPSYIPSTIFARVLADVVEHRRARTSEATAARAPEPAKSAPAPLPATLRQSLATLASPPSAAESVAAGRGAAAMPDLATLEQWYDQHMERVSGWYKRHTQSVVLAVSVVLTLGTNADSVGLAKRLWSDSALRSTIIEEAKTRIQQGPPLQTVEYSDPTTPAPTPPTPGTDSGAQETGSADRLSAAEQSLLGNVLGWSGERERLAGAQRDHGSAAGLALWVLLHLPGWLITAFAVSLGAPFWFDTLNRITNVRAAGRPPESSTRSQR